MAADFPPTAEAVTGRPSSRHGWWRGGGLALGLIVALACFLVASAAAQPTRPMDPCSGPEPRPTPCAPAPQPTSSPSTPRPTTAPNTCTSIPPGQVQPPGCIPQPTTAPLPAPTGGQQPGQPTTRPDDDCGFTDIGACISESIDDFFRRVVTEALNPLLDLLTNTLLTTPTLDSLPRVGELWNESWQILLACYGILIMLAGLLVMAYESVQSRHSMKEIAPRLAVGFLMGALSLFLAGKAIEIANALARAVMGDGVEATSAGTTLKNMIMSSLNGGIFTALIGVVLACVLVALLVTYAVRVAVTVILVAGAPIMLMFHALPQTEGVASTWWKAFGSCLGIQVAQSLALITPARVLLAPGGFTIFGPTNDGMANLLIALALVYVLFKIPFWILGRLSGGGKSFAGSIVRAYVMGKTMGLLGNSGGSGRRTNNAHRGSSGRGSASTAQAAAKPVAAKRSSGSNQSPQAIGRRLQAQQARAQAARRGRSVNHAPKFLQPSPQAPTHYIATGKATTAPAMPQFQSTAPADTTASGPLPITVPLGPPVFTAPGGPQRTSPPPPRIRPAAVPPHLQFQSATPVASVRPVHASGPPPERPLFQQPVTDNAARRVRARTHTPAPVLFHAPPPASPPAPTPSAQRAKPARPLRPGGERP
ncbi:hypothetical protein [Umezawaea sp. NPDC059074]|uniref:hypothetical protein n=1 Tax=Umezawaea sp. NPDC059074 TaxID=3346716 RepID=UPI003683BCE4